MQILRRVKPQLSEVLCFRAVFSSSCDSIAQVRLLRTQVHDEPSVWAAPSIRAAPPTAAARCALHSPLPLFHVSSGHSCPWLCSAPRLWGVPAAGCPAGKGLPAAPGCPAAQRAGTAPAVPLRGTVLGPGARPGRAFEEPVQCCGPGGSCSWSCRLSSQESSGKKPWTADPLPNKGLGDQWPGQVRDTHRRGWQKPTTPEFHTLRLWGYKSPGSLLRGTRLELLFYDLVTTPRLNYSKALLCKTCGRAGKEIWSVSVWAVQLQRGFGPSSRGANVTARVVPR